MLSFSGSSANNQTQFVTAFLVPCHSRFQHLFFLENVQFLIRYLSYYHLLSSTSEPLIHVVTFFSLYSWICVCFIIFTCVHWFKLVIVIFFHLFLIIQGARIFVRHGGVYYLIHSTWNFHSIQQDLCGFKIKVNQMSSLYVFVAILFRLLWNSENVYSHIRVSLKWLMKWS